MRDCNLYTRVQRDVKSVIDFFLVNECMHRKFERLVIDEKKESYDMSDHCYMSGLFTVGEGGARNRDSGWEIRVL